MIDYNDSYYSLEIIFFFILISHGGHITIIKIGMHGLMKNYLKKFLK